MRRTFRTLNDCEMQHNAEVGLFTRPSRLGKKTIYGWTLLNYYQIVNPKLGAASILLQIRLPPMPVHHSPGAGGGNLRLWFPADGLRTPGIRVGRCLPAMRTPCFFLYLRRLLPMLHNNWGTAISRQCRYGMQVCVLNLPLPCISPVSYTHLTLPTN